MIRRVFALGLIASLWASGTAAQVPAGITPDQIARFKSLPPAQQEMLAKQYGVDLDQLKGGGSLANPVPVLEQPQVVMPLQPAQEQTTHPSAAGKPAKLKRFGYDLFAGSPTTFAPVTEIPIPAEYVVGPGDTIHLQLFGKSNQSHELLVNRDGAIQLPEVGPVPVAGLTFDALRSQITRLVKEKYIGVEAAISLGQLRSMQVFVLGEARTPGAYTVSSLSTMTNALFVSGGVRETGSLRKIQLKRQGNLVATLDLYDLLLKGDTSADLRLMPGDVLFIPPVGITVAIDGEVRRPAIYELKEETGIRELVQIAGGYRPEAYPKFTKVQRVAQGFKRSVLDVDASTRTGEAFAVRNGDHVSIGSVNDLVEGFVTLSGSVSRPGKYDWKPGLRLSSLLPSIRYDLKQNAELGYALIVREINERKDIRVLNFDLAQAINQAGTEADPVLSDRDQVLVFTRNTSREELLKPVLDQLSQQTRPGEPPQIVTIEGSVRVPGRYPLPAGASLRELISAAGGLLDSSYTLQAEVSRSINGVDGSHVEILDVQLQTALQDPAQDFLLQGRDRVLVKQIPEFAERQTVALQGEVRFPGVYAIRKGETLAGLIQRAGGFTSQAYPEGAIFSRARLKELEQARLQEAEARLNRDLLALKLEAANGDDKAAVAALGDLQTLLDKVQTTKPLGRMVIDLPAIMAGKSGMDIVLQDQDSLVVPQVPQSVTVIGEVQFATSHVYNPAKSVTDYIEQSGGTNAQADEDRIYVVKANGAVWLPEKSSWFSGRRTLEPGDTIVVPLEVDRLNKLQLWTNVTQVFYQIALGAAAVGSL